MKTIPEGTVELMLYWNPDIPAQLAIHVRNNKCLEERPFCTPIGFRVLDPDKFKY